jgi:Flp pilus assembly protein TadD
VAVLLSTTTAFAQAYKGTGRVQGVVTDSSGKPVQGATVKLFSTKAKSGPPPIKTDKNGKWTAMGLTSGTWNLDVEAEGFMPEKGSVELSELQRIPPLKTQLTPSEAPRVQEVEVAVEVPKTGISQEAVDAVNSAQSLLDEAEGRTLSLEPVTEARKKQLYSDVVAKLNHALTLIPEAAENASARTQIQQVLAQTYYKTGELKQAIESLQKVSAANPDNAGVRLLLANLLLEDGRLEEGKAVLEQLPAGTVTDPTAYINVGILFMNRNKAQDAYVYFDKAVSLDPKRGESYYYRGLSLLPQGRNKEAKADFEKVVALSPESSEAKDAQDVLKQMQ